MLKKLVAPIVLTLTGVLIAACVDGAPLPSPTAEETKKPEKPIIRTVTQVPPTFIPILSIPTYTPESPTATATHTPSPTNTLIPPTPTVMPEPWIEVDLSEQKLYFHLGNETYKFLVSTGLPKTPTLPGTFEIYAMFETCDMEGPGYSYKNVRYCMWYDWRGRGYGLHATYWHKNFGHPMSHGCVNLSEEHARWIYSHAKIGTRVFIRE